MDCNRTSHAKSGSRGKHSNESGRLGTNRGGPDKLRGGCKTGIGKWRWLCESPVADHQIYGEAPTGKTDEERQALSKEIQAAMQNRHHYSSRVEPDGSFNIDDVLPGPYEINFHINGKNARMGSFVSYTSPKELVVPPTTDTNDDTPVDLGDIELVKHVITPPAGAKTEK